MNTLENRNPADISGITPIHLASENGHYEMCCLIMDTMKTKSVADINGWTPFGNISAYYEDNGE
jgi:ankyrin repeat protein